MTVKRCMVIFGLCAALALGLPHDLVNAEPIGPAGTQLINGDFESGSGVGWVEYSQVDVYPLILSWMWLPITPHDDSLYATWLGSLPNEVSYIKQQVAVTSATPLLSFWYWIRSDELQCTRDYGRVIVNSEQVTTFGLCMSNKTADWTERHVDLSLYTGQTVWVQLQADTNATLTSDLFLDDVFLEANPLGPLTVAASRNGASARLTWQHASGYTAYQVWRSTTPYFLPGATDAELRATLPPPSSGTLMVYDDAGGVGNTAVNYFYVVRGAGAGVTRAANRTAEFDFSLTRGG